MSRRILTAMTVIVTVALVMSSAGCLVQEEKPVDKNKVPADRADARLVVDGVVDAPLNWTLQKVVDLGPKDFTARTTNSVGTVINSTFTGVHLSDVLDSANVRQAADMMQIVASDGYTAVMFAKDVKETTFLAFKEGGNWLNLTDSGALRLVDSNLSASYWVKKVVAIHIKSSTPLTIQGLAYRSDFLTPAWLHDNGYSTVRWKEGTKNRTAIGMSLNDLLTNISADRAWGLLMRLTGSSNANVTFRIKGALATEMDYLAVDSKGQFVYVRDQSVLVSGVKTLEISAGVYIYGLVGHEVNLTVSDIRSLPPREILLEGKTYHGAALETVLAAAGLTGGADKVEVGPVSGPSINVSVALLTNTTLAYDVNSTPLGMDGGYLALLSDQGGQIAKLGSVIWLRAWKST